jgi:tRNA (guanine37-N1)-methyltransferase
VTRLVPGVIEAQSATDDSFADGLLEHPQYTRPEEFRGASVPAVLLSGNHAEVARWRRRESLRRTLVRRPDLLARAMLDDGDRAALQQLAREEGVELPPMTPASRD